MPSQKLEFPNDEGHTLSAALELPDGGHASAFAVFAHCFTCGEDGAAASRIARALAARGIAVLRFDFTGLGNSDGDFANSDSSPSVGDLVAAAVFLEKHYRAPELLVGHGLGGAAVLSAAHDLPDVKAIATIGAPATAAHFAHLFDDSIDEIKKRGTGVVTLGTRKFTITSRLIEDLEKFADSDHIGRLGRALLVFHSPIDRVVSIDEAARIYQAAKHPKSFISLDKADHLLSRKEDSEYVAAVLAVWASRYLSETTVTPTAERQAALSDGEVLVTEENEQFLRGMYTHAHYLQADEPRGNGGTGLGPDPYELLLMSLGACTSMTLRLYAGHKNLPVSNIEVRLRHERIHARDCEDCESTEGYVSRIERRIRYEGALSAEQHRRLMEIADKCPVHKTLKGEIQIVTSSDPDALPAGADEHPSA